MTVQGDVLVVIYHARSTLGGRLQAKVMQRLFGSYIQSAKILYSHIRKRKNLPKYFNPKFIETS